MAYQKVHLESEHPMDRLYRTACGQTIQEKTLTTFNWQVVSCDRCRKSNLFLLKRGY